MIKDLLKKKNAPGKEGKGKNTPADPAPEKKLTKRGLAEQKRLAKKEKLKKRFYMALGGLVFLSFIIWFGMQPLKGSIQYGVCRTFLEMQLKYPHTIKMTFVEIFDKSLRMYYTYNDAFGSIRSEMMECDFRPFNLLNLETVKRDREPVDRNLVTEFNKTIPAVVAADPNLIVPAPPKGTLMELKRD